MILSSLSVPQVDKRTIRIKTSVVFNGIPAELRMEPVTFFTLLTAKAVIWAESTKLITTTGMFMFTWSGST